MLVAISDLHFTDGTTSNRKGQRDLFNIDSRAFELFFGRIANIIQRRKTKISKVTFIYNGDIFDPLRTYAWFKVPQNSRPWSVPLNRKQVLQKSHKILEETTAHNKEALAWLSGTHDDFDSVWTVGAQIDRVYVPGNHDRLINLYGPSRKLVRKELLGQTGTIGNPRFENRYADLEHQAIFMHGHEADKFNCEFNRDGEPQYDAVPIGDPMTTMLFTRLGYEAGALPIHQGAKSRFRDIDNVRPPLAGIRYVQDIIRDYGFSKELEAMIRRIVRQFDRLPFYREWQKQHDRWNWDLRFDEADKLQDALRAVRLLGTSLPAGLLERLAGLLRDDSCQKWAKRVLEADLNADKRYCVLGHTHDPVHVPLCVDKRNGVENHYLNCGTFRTAFVQTFDKEDFLRHQRMSFVLIYNRKELEKSTDIPAYEMWSGLRMIH